MRGLGSEKALEQGTAKADAAWSQCAATRVRTKLLNANIIMLHNTKDEYTIVIQQQAGQPKNTSNVQRSNAARLAKTTNINSCLAIQRWNTTAIDTINHKVCIDWSENLPLAQILHLYVAFSEEGDVRGMHMHPHTPSTHSKQSPTKLSPSHTARSIFWKKIKRRGNEAHSLRIVSV